MYESKNDEVSILFGGMFPILSDGKIESMAVSYLFDWKKDVDDPKQQFSQRVEKYLKDYSSRINNPKNIVDLIEFIKQNNGLLEEKYECLIVKSIENLYTILQTLTSKF